MSLQREQRGMTLVEVMVASVLGLILLMGVMQVFVSTRQANLMERGLERIQENARFAMEKLRQTISMAEYVDNPGTDPSTIYVSGTEAIIGTEGGSNPDSLTIRMQSDGTIRSCNGNSTITAGDLVRYTFSVDTSDIDLDCETQVASGSPTGAQPIVDGVSNLQLLYGEDTDADGVPNAYRNAGNVTDWDNVISVRVGILVRGAETVLTENNSASFDLPGATVSVNDRYQYKAFVTTIVLRNRLP